MKNYISLFLIPFILVLNSCNKEESTNTMLDAILDDAKVSICNNNTKCFDSIQVNDIVVTKEQENGKYIIRTINFKLVNGSKSQDEVGKKIFYSKAQNKWLYNLNFRAL